MNARGFTLIEIIVTIILMAIMGFMAAQLIATTLRGSAESAGQIKDLTEATSTLEECIAYLNTEAMQQKAASDLITDKGLEALLEAQDKRELWHPDGCPSCPSPSSAVPWSFPVRSDARAPERGFTLLEIVCTLVILGVLGSLVFSGFGTAITGYTQMREVGTSDMQAELALIRLRKELAGAADFPESPFKDSPSVTFTKTDGTQTTISCEDTGNKLLIDGQILLSDVASCRFTTNGAGPSYIGIVLTQQLAERQVTWTLSVAPRNTPLAKD